jgi:hypothetical protein
VPKILNFYVDDSGTRHPDHDPPSGTKEDWFALGGVLVREGDDEGNCRTRHENFCTRWGLRYPLHSFEIRHSAGRFGWLKSLSEADRERFMADLGSLLTGIPVIGLACVIDRPGYNDRYTKTYGRKRWHLCKTAFTIAVERAAKYAMSIKHKLNVFVERCSPTDDAKILDYYKELRISGAPFDAGRSLIYGPLKAGDLADTLYDIKLKKKSSPMIQVADLYLWPMCQGGYDATHRPYALLRHQKKLMDDYVPAEAVAELGVKYSCFDLKKRKT